MCNLFLIVFLLRISLSSQHARLMEPPSRASMWRVGFPTPKDQDDNQAYCGGFGVQYNVNGGKCGICGDPWDQSPRAHEAPGGIYANGIITKTYRQGSLIPVIVDITANHQGYFIFKLCPNNNIFVDPDQSCFDHYTLTTGWGDTIKYPITDYVTGLRLLYVRLPLDVTCEQCILQWSYVGGNNWGTCDNGTSGLGCGPQETFRSCADIRIEPHPLLSDTKTSSPSGSDPDLTIDFSELNSLDNDNKEALLRRKKAILEKVLQKLQELILVSQEGGKDDDYQDYNDLEDLRSEASNLKIFAPRSDVDYYYDDVGRPEVERSEGWWKKIFSNRHKK